MTPSTPDLRDKFTAHVRTGAPCPVPGGVQLCGPPMTAPMTLSEAVEEARKRGVPSWLTQNAKGEWWIFSKLIWDNKPARGVVGWVGRYSFLLGTGAPNPDGWRETLTEVR